MATYGTSYPQAVAEAKIGIIGDTYGGKTGIMGDPLTRSLDLKNNEMARACGSVQFAPQKSAHLFRKRF